VGAPCNGCGVCPVGVVVSRRLRGACSALHWQNSRYHCGVLLKARHPLTRWLLARWIAAGIGCDSTLEPR
jgi:hypothetical protein